MKTTGEIIKELRLKNGMSQTELACKVGYAGRSAISKIELGEFDININDAEKWAKALGVETVDLLGEFDTPEAAGARDAEILTNPRIMHLVNCYLSMSPEQQAIIDNLCNQFTGDA